MLEALDQGFFELEKLQPFAQQLQDDHVKWKLEAKFHDSWKKYYDGFEDNQDELVSDLSASFRDAIRYISPANANSTILLFRSLGYDALASELLELYVSSRSVDTFDIRGMFSAGDVSDPEFAAAVQKKLAEIVDLRNPADVLVGIAKNRSWNPEDVRLLSQVDAAGYYDIFKNTRNGDDLDAAIRMALDFGKMICGNGGEAAIGKNARAALLMIASESKLNERRVARYGVGADESNTAE